MSSSSITCQSSAIKPKDLVKSMKTYQVSKFLQINGGVMIFLRCIGSISADSMSSMGNASLTEAYESTLFLIRSTVAISFLTSVLKYPSWSWFSQKNKSIGGNVSDGSSNLIWAMALATQAMLTLGSICPFGRP